MAIRELRNQRGLSQQALGELSQIHPTWISHIESGRNNPSWDSVKRIAAALEVRLAELAKRAEELEVPSAQLA